MKWNWWRKWWQKPLPYVDSLYPSKRPFISPPFGRRKRIPTKNIDRYYIPLSVMEGTNKIFRNFGIRHSEGYAWWTGYINSESEAQVCTVLYPAIKTNYGCVRLDRNMLTIMHRQLIGMDQILLIELHTHPPGAGGQNHVDADNAACYYPGFISIVVPDFGAPRFYDLRNCYVYSYVDKGVWDELSPKVISQRFFIEENVIEVNYS
jgi:hypothetical protein